MPKETPEAKRARKAAAKAAARERAARIMEGLVQPPRPPQPERSSWVKVVQAQPEKPARALIPPTNTPLPERDREQYADNVPMGWVKPNA
ncbi:hypothetical protein [Streptomyces sp. DSM 41033]|uniref:hypothetical protein n=1 Tax=Streptomyces sp. DSM 41033 TaxID=3448655 RepID=UPI0040403A6A